MKKNQQRLAWGTLVILLLGYGGVLQLRPVRAGGPNDLESPGVAYTWGGSPPTAAGPDRAHSKHFKPGA